MKLIIEPEWNPDTEEDCYAWSWTDESTDIVLGGGYGATIEDAANDAAIWAKNNQNTIKQ